MIVKMSRYDFVLLATQSEDFIEKVRELGLVDITTIGWEPTEQDRQLLIDIEQYQKAIDYLKEFADGETMNSAAAPYASGEEAFEAYTQTQQARAALLAETARLDKLAEELEAWGEFGVESREALAQGGVMLKFFITPISTYEEQIATWSEQYTIAEINRNSSSVYFVVVTTDETEIMLDAQEVKMPAMDYRRAKSEAEQNRREITQLDAEFSRSAVSLPKIEEQAELLKRKLQSVKICGSAEQAAEGSLVVMEGWAEQDKSAEVDALLEEYPGVVYLKAAPTPEDNTPVKLQNNRFARLFELIGGMYALPKYGTLDLTPFFAPFYMLFFAICLNDAGYGAIIFALGLVLMLKGGEKMRQASWLTMVCGGATTLFGLYSGSLFGLSLPALLGYESIADSPFLDFQNDFFSYALALGVVQILFGMLLNICFKAKYFGVKTIFAQLGWFLIIASACVAGGLQMLNPDWVIPCFTLSSPAFYVVAGAGAVMMLFMSDLKRNPLINFAGGLWDTYNNITALLSDVLSYIRLFAIGLSGGVLAQVFNSLAMGLTGLSEGIESFGVGTVFQILGAATILLIGHGINLFMSTISSFVHPMRLTFVEFYKNAGFEMSSREFEPLTNNKK